MVRLITDRIAARGKFGNLHACGVLGKFMGLLPGSDFRSCEAQVLMTQYVKLNALGALHLFHASVHVQGIGT
jgi:hypothetical protein